MTRDSVAEGRRLLTGRRLTALGLGTRTPAADANDTTGVVRNLLALQAQDYAGALWSIGLRTASCTRAQVEVEHRERGIVRSWTMRGTLHFVAADDLPWMLSITGPRMVRAAEGRRRRLGIDEAQLARAERIVRDRLGGGGTASRAQLYTAWESEGLPTSAQRGIHFLGHLAQTSLIVLVGHTEWALLDDVVPSPRVLERSAGLQEFALRYFNGHGPATVVDFATWSGLTLRDAREGMTAARERLEEFELDGQQFFQRMNLEPAADGVLLLPGFDEYLLGYADRRAQLGGADTALIAPGANGLFRPTVIVDGQVAGTWQRSETGTRVSVSPEPFQAFSDATRHEIATQASRYADFIGLPLAVE